MKIGWLVGAMLVHAAAQGQDISGLISGGVKVLQREGKIPSAPGVGGKPDPLEPRQNEGLPPKEGRLPEPQANARNRIEIVGDIPEVFRMGDRFSFKGGVHIRYRGYDILADEVEGSTATNVFTARGRVKAIGKDEVLVGALVTIDFNAETFRAETTEAQLRPSFVQGRVLDDLYIKGALSYGSAREVWAEDGSFTTCNLDYPHYEILSDRADVRPGRRAILRKVDLKILGKTILRIPFLAVPLDEARERYTPDVGQSPDEGYYVKNWIGVPTRSAADNLVARLDYMTKLGTGLGGNYGYSRRGVEGFLRSYAVLGAIDTLNIENDHRQRVGSVDLSLTNNFQRNNYLNAPESTTWVSRLSGAIVRGLARTGITYGRSSNSSSGFDVTNQTVGLQDTRRIGRLQSNLSLNYTDNSTSGIGTPVRREQAAVQFQGRYELSKGVAQLDYLRTIPIGDTVNFIGSSDRTPLLSFRTDERRLIGPGFSKFLRFTSDVSVGEFGVGRTGERVTRSAFDLNVNRPDNPNRRSALSLNGRFRQGIYSDDTAQYVAGLGADYRYRLGRDTGVNLRYNFLRAYGFSPLPLDRLGKTNFLSADVNVRPIRTLLLGAGTGYDFLLESREEVAWQTVGLRAEFTPFEWLQARAYSTYDPSLAAFSSVRLDFTYLPGATRVTAGLRYDGIRHTWSNANLLVDGFKWGRLMASALLSYNGFLKKFEARHFSFSYDLHCAEAVLQIIDNPVGFRSGREIVFFIRLKAFPFDTNFGVGRRGQPIGTGTGRNY